MTTRCVSPANNTRSLCYYQSFTKASRFLAPESKTHHRQHVQSQFLLALRSTCAIPFTQLATMASSSKMPSSLSSHPTDPSPISVEQYHRLSDAYIDALVTKLEALQEEREGVDVEYSAGVLTLIFPPVGTYVLNKQPPNKQIWLSSPISGPKRYDWIKTSSGREEGQWVYLRDGSTLDGLLVAEIGIEPEDD